VSSVDVRYCKHLGKCSAIHAMRTTYKNCEGGFGDFSIEISREVCSV